MTTLREAAQQALEALEQRYNATLWYQAIHALRDALAQEEQEPVLVVEKEPDYMSRGHFYEGSKSFIDPTEVWKLPIGTKLYTHPPRREWRGLTMREINALPEIGGVMWRMGTAPAALRAIRAIERALKEKNHG